MTEVIHTARQQLLPALDVLADVMSDKSQNSATRTSAARFMIEVFTKLSEREELVARIERLEKSYEFYA